MFFVCWLLVCARCKTLSVVPYLPSDRDTGRDEVFRKKIKKEWFQINTRAQSRPKFADFEERH